MLHVSLQFIVLNIVIALLQMVDGHTLFDYNVGLNEIIQILVRKTAAVTDSSVAEEAETTASEESELNETENASVRCTNFVPLVNLTSVDCDNFLRLVRHVIL